MDAVIAKLIDNLNSSVFVLIILLLISFYVVHKLGEWKNKLANTDKIIEGLNQDHKTIEKLSAKLDLIYDIVNPKAYTKTKSPISLTELGKEVADKIKAEIIFNKHKDKLVKCVNKEKPANAYDIQMASFKVAREELPNLLTIDEMNIIKQDSFNRGTLVDDIWTIFAIILRDEILKIKGLSVSDVDKYNPNN